MSAPPDPLFHHPPGKVHFKAAADRVHSFLWLFLKRVSSFFCLFSAAYLHNQKELFLKCQTFFRSDFSTGDSSSVREQEPSPAAAMSCPSYASPTDGHKSFQWVVKMEMVPLVWNRKCCTWNLLQISLGGMRVGPGPEPRASKNHSYSPLLALPLLPLNFPSQSPV